MPTFDFQCKACGHTFEYQRPFGSKTKPVCSACKSKRVEKLMSLPMIAFKGDGFYKTDSTKTAAKPAAAPEKKEEKAKVPTTPEPPKTEKKDSAVKDK